MLSLATLKSRLENPNMFKQLQWDIVNRGRKGKRMWKSTTDYEYVIKEQGLFFGLCQND